MKILIGTTNPSKVEYFAEMLCDRVAASMIYLGDKFTAAAPLEYYLSHRDENQFHIHTRQELEYWLEYIADVGVDVAFKTLKGMLGK